MVTTIGCDGDGWRRVLGLGVIDAGVRLVTPDAHEGLRRAIGEAFRGAVWQRRAVYLMRE